MRTPLFLPLACVVSGLFCAVLFDLRAPLWSVGALLLCLLCASIPRHPLPFLAALAAFSFVWGASSVERLLQEGASWQRLAGGEPCLVEGELSSRPEGRGDGGGRVYLDGVRLWRGEGDPVALPGKLLLFVGEGRLHLATGDRVRLSSRLRTPRGYGLPGEGDYPRSLALQGVRAVAFVREAGEVVLVKSGRGWRGRVDAHAATLCAFIERSVPGVEGGILQALLLGENAGVPPEVQEAYARSGVNHVLSISGFHVGIIYLSLFHVIFLLGRLSERATLACNLRRTLLVAALPVTVLYLFLSGCAPATLRSVLMIGCLTCALCLRRETAAVNVIAVAAAAILAVAPETLFDISFQLSFLAVWGLAVLTPLLMPGEGRVKGWWRALLLSLCASLSAILATAVPVAYHFHRVSLAGVLCNLAVVPLIGYGAVVLGFASLLLAYPFPEPARLLLGGAALLVRLCDRVILFFARFPVLEYQPDRIDCALALLALCLLTSLSGRRLRAGSALLICALVAWRAVPHAAAADGMLHVLFLSVGQGDAALLRLPDGKTMLIDGGGSFAEGDSRVGERLLVPALLALKVRRIDYLVLSHPHPDHLQGLLPVAARWEVGEFWESGVPCGSREYRELRWVLSARGVPRRVVRAGIPPVAAGGALVEALWPPPSLRAPSADANEDSLVLRVRCGRGAVLFTGDLGGGAEEGVVAGGGPLSCTVLKVPHHGSRRSCSDPFLSACAPSTAVISAGYGNPFHLPAAATVKRLEKHGIRVHRTDLEGSVEALVSPDGRCQVRTPWRGHFN